jgi:hydroxypyruvate isomerase
MPKFAANLTMQFNEVPFLERFDASAAAGFAAVEYMFPYPHRAEEIALRLRRTGQQQVLFNLPAGNWEGGDRGIAVDPGRVAEFRRGVSTAIEYAIALGCRQVNCLAGITPRETDPALAHATLVGNLAFAAKALAAEDIKLLIEPINTRDIPGFYLCHTRQALEIIREVGAPNLLLQYDAYHMQVMEGDLTRTIETYLRQIAHIQIADNPGRHEPGTGEINYPFIFRELDRMGYTGWIGCEYKPSGRTVDGLGWLPRG